MQSLNAVTIMDAVIMYGVVRAVWWTFAFTYRATRKDYEAGRDRAEVFRKHGIERHDLPANQCDINMCATVV